MRHLRGNVKLNKPTGQREAMLNNLVKQLITHERLETTDARAKALMSVAEKVVTIGKQNTVHARRMAYRVLQDRDLVKKLFDEIAPRFATRAGGYCRLMYKGFRAGDGARTAIVEFVERKAKAVVEKAEGKTEVKAEAKAETKPAAKKKK